MVVASALIPFSPEQISVIAQNQQRLFRDVIGHRSKQSILKAIQGAGLTSVQIIEFAVALDRNRERLLPEEMWEDVRVPLIIEMTRYTGRQIDFIAQNSSGRFINFLGVGVIGVHVRFFLINFMSNFLEHRRP